MYILYCIFRVSKLPRQALPLGVGGQPVFQVEGNGLGAAVSELSAAHLTPDVPGVLEYKRVVESFFGNRTVIPMRYGCVFRERAQICRLLIRNARQYEALFIDLEGCVEMGILLEIDECGSSLADLSENGPAAGSSGKAYLAARKARYAQEERITEEKDEIAGQFRAALAGLFVKCKVETPAMPNRQSSLLSLYFLVPGESLDPFRQVFRRMSRELKTTKLLLSGPRPPYNFVLPDNEVRRPGLPDEEAKGRQP